MTPANNTKLVRNPWIYITKQLKMHELTIKIIDQVEMILAGAFGAIEKSLWVRTLKPNKKKCLRHILNRLTLTILSAAQ